MRNQVGAMSRKVARNALASLAALCCAMLAGCGGRPERAVCADPSVRGRVIEIIYEAADATADIASEKGLVKQLSSVRSQLGLLRRQGVIRMSGETMQSYDAVSGRADCSATINYVLPASDRMDSEEHLIGVLSPARLSVDINGQDPRSIVTYSVSQIASGGGNVVETHKGAEAPTVLLIVAAARVQLAKGSY